MHLAWRIHHWGWPINNYPHQYHYNQANWGTIQVDPRGIAARSFVEFPIVQNGLYDGGLPGPDRVVFDAATGTFAGVLTHRLQQNNRFVPCYGQNRTQLLPTVATFIVPIVNPTANPALIGFLGSGPNNED
jgi:ribonuclease